MSATPKIIFSCSNCDAQFPKWSGRCEECGKWGTLEQRTADLPATAKQQRAYNLGAVAAVKPLRFSEITEGAVARVSTGIGECDRVLGGGIVPGSLILLGGDPGIGKSTLVAQIAGSVQASVLYVSGEESAQQIKLRLDRLGIAQQQLLFVSEEHVEVICKTILETKPALVIIDSIQTVASSSVESEPGSVNQIKASTVRFLEVAKSTNIPIIIIGHVTKGGELGGPKTLEHIVDTVLYLEGERHHQFRLLRAVKNRFGATNEVGVFDMQARGLQEVQDPSQVFVQERSAVAGSCLTAVMEGSRIFLVEVQALVSKTSFGFPQRKASGFDVNRLNLLLAVLGQRADCSFEQHDVYLNIVGGSAFREPAMDLAICAALVSALRNIAVSTETICWGEVGLGGEVRSVAREKDRTKEAKRFGLSSVISPKTAKSLRQAITQLGLDR
ncbi:MAG: DNA repair protein RadA [Candidatus Kerfeldbacteria bacterium]|nr:DNA repair protein RadA [Candidatus Kerfeldbacteria bacterium]